MIINNENTATARLASDDVLERFEDEPRVVEFGDDGTARVPAEVGEYLAETREAITIETDERENTNT